MNEFIKPQIKEALRAVFKRASTDASFRAKCISDPSAAIEEVGGGDALAGQQIRFVEPNSELIITLPAIGVSDEMLDEEVLKGVAAAGGSGSTGDQCPIVSHGDPLHC